MLGESKTLAWGFAMAPHRLRALVILTDGSFNNFLASSDLCHLLITCAKSLDPDHDKHNVGPNLDPNGLKL